MAKSIDERELAHTGNETCKALSRRRADARIRRIPAQLYEKPAQRVVHAEEMPFENSPDGLLKHLVHERLGQHA